MVEISEIRKSNAAYAAQDHSGLICVFAGATAGIGAATLKEMVSLLRSSTFYILGREPHRYQHKLNELKNSALRTRSLLLELRLPLFQELIRQVHSFVELPTKLTSSV